MPAHLVDYLGIPLEGFEPTSCLSWACGVRERFRRPGRMKSHPLSSLNHLTVPSSMCYKSPFFSELTRQPNIFTIFSVAPGVKGFIRWLWSLSA